MYTQEDSARLRIAAVGISTNGAVQEGKGGCAGVQGRGRLRPAEGFGGW